MGVEQREHPAAWVNTVRNAQPAPRAGNCNGEHAGVLPPCRGRCAACLWPWWCTCCTASARRCSSASRCPSWSSCPSRSSTRRGAPVHGARRRAWGAAGSARLPLPPRVALCCTPGRAGGAGRGDRAPQLQQPRPPRPPRCSLRGGKERSLDLICKNGDEFDTWFWGLQIVITWAQASTLHGRGGGAAAAVVAAAVVAAAAAAGSHPTFSSRHSSRSFTTGSTSSADASTWLAAPQLAVSRQCGDWAVRRACVSPQGMSQAATPTGQPNLRRSSPGFGVQLVRARPHRWKGGGAAAGAAGGGAGCCSGLLPSAVVPAAAAASAPPPPHTLILACAAAPELEGRRVAGRQRPVAGTNAVCVHAK